MDRVRLRREEGVALPITVTALAILGTLAALVTATAVQLSGTSNVDRDSKRALSAAEAGLHAATYRVNKLGPRNANCLTSIATAPVGGQCPGLSQDMGNGSEFTYWVTPVMASTDTCAGLPVQAEAGGALLVVQRCVTARGRVNGVVRRVQARVASYQGVPIFPVGGILGLEGVTVRNSARVQGSIGSNGQIALGNSSLVGPLELPQGAPEPRVGGSSTTGGTIRRTPAQGDWVLAPVDVGDSATSNDNGRILTREDPSTNVTYDAATRELVMGNNSSLTLSGGDNDATYNFCRIALGNNAQVNIAVGAKVRLFLDSPERTGSGCAGVPGAGTITIGQNSFFNNPSGIAENLQIYISGTSDGQSVVDFRNSSFISGAIYAPQSRVVFKNSATVVGALAARNVEFQNDVSFTWSESLAELRGRTVTQYYRSAWAECRPEPPVAGDPESGC